MDELDTGFEPLTPGDAPDIMSGYRGQWWVAGGWALDLVGGAKTRDHIDLDIGIYREDIPHLFTALADMELHAAGDGRLLMMSRPEDLPATSNSIWARRAGAARWLFELILNESDGADWVFRRDHRIRLERASISITVDGIPCVRPEVQLLFKAKHMRDRDIADFDAHSPILAPASRSWLKEALSLAHPGHPWIDRL